MDITFIIINYNTTALTLACIQSVYQFTKVNSFEVIVIDNASADRSILELTRHFPMASLLVNKENVGFGRANNLGILQARGKYICLLNSDTLLTCDACETFFNYMEDESNHKVACCGASLIDGIGRPQVSYGNFPSFFEAISSIGFLLLYKQYYYRHLSSGVFNYFNENKSVDYVCGADMFIRKSILSEIGLFDPDFFLYFEEVELSLRLKKAGYQSVIMPGVKIVHHEGASQDADKLAIQKIVQFAESRRLYFSKCYGNFSGMLINKIYALQALVFLCVKQKKAYLAIAKILFLA